MPIKMMYDDGLHDLKEVDVYSFHTVEETLECYATCWVSAQEYWMTVPIYMLVPIKNESNRKSLNE